MSAQVTEAHRELARRIMFEFTQAGTATASDVRMAAQIIADSEAKAVAEWQSFVHLKGEAIDSLLLECNQLRAEVERLKHGTVAQFKDAFIEELKRENAELRASCDEHAKGYVETRKRIATLETEIDRLHAINAVRESAIARAERAEDELANIRALANRRNKRDHSQDTTHQLVAALDQALDIAQAELATERARIADLVADLNDACITLTSAEEDCDDYAMQNTRFKLTAVREVLLQHIPNAAMKEETK